MFHKILVAIDLSDLAEHVVEIAIAQAKTTGGNLLLLHIINVHEKEFPQLEGHISGSYNPEAFDAEAQSYEQYWNRYEQMGLQALQAHRKRAIAAGVGAEFTQQTGDLVDNSGETICAIAQEWEADLIIIGHRGLSGVKELIQGSVSNYVFHHAPCSVLSVYHPITSKTEPASAHIPAHR
jgi:nucleotide-binding universal stress UspA family protein